MQTSLKACFDVHSIA